MPLFNAICGVDELFRFANPVRRFAFNLGFVKFQWKWISCRRVAKVLFEKWPLPRKRLPLFHDLLSDRTIRGTYLQTMCICARASGHVRTIGKHHQFLFCNSLWRCIIKIKNKKTKFPSFVFACILRALIVAILLIFIERTM